MIPQFRRILFASIHVNLFLLVVGKEQLKCCLQQMSSYKTAEEINAYRPLTAFAVVLPEVDNA